MIASCDLTGLPVATLDVFTVQTSETFTLEEDDEFQRDPSNRQGFQKAIDNADSCDLLNRNILSITIEIKKGGHPLSSSLC